MTNQNDQAQKAIEKPLFALLQKRRKQIEGIIPNFLTPERVLQLVNVAILREPKLLECSPHSVVNAIMHASLLGLEIAPEQAYLVPFRNKHTGRREATLLIDYRGKRDIVVSGGLVHNIHPYVVYSRDEFSLSLNPATGAIEPHYTPVVDRKGENGERLPIENEAQRGVPLGVLSLAPLKSGGTDVLWMPKLEIDAIKKRSRASDDGPWQTDEMEMWKKTAVHRHIKSLPKPRDVFDFSKAKEPPKPGEPPAPPSPAKRIAQSQEVDDMYEMGESLAPIIEADFEDEQPIVATGTPEQVEEVAQRKIEELRNAKPERKPDPVPMPERSEEEVLAERYEREAKENLQKAKQADQQNKPAAVAPLRFGKRPS